jgi:hypothetical protein
MGILELQVNMHPIILVDVTGESWQEEFKEPIAKQLLRM